MPILSVTVHAHGSCTPVILDLAVPAQLGFLKGVLNRTTGCTHIPSRDTYVIITDQCMYTFQHPAPSEGIRIGDLMRSGGGVDLEKLDALIKGTSVQAPGVPEVATTPAMREVPVPSGGQRVAKDSK